MSMDVPLRFAGTQVNTAGGRVQFEENLVSFYSLFFFQSEEGVA